MPLRVSLITLLVPLSLLAAGHDISTVRYAPPDNIYAIGGAAVAFNGNHFLTIWPMETHVYGALADPVTGATTTAFPVRPFAPTWEVQLIAAGGGFIAVWNADGRSVLASLTAEGVVTREVELQQTSLAGTPKIAWNGTHLLIVDYKSNSTINAPANITASLYDVDGRLLARNTLPVFGFDWYDVTESDGEFEAVTAGRSGVHVFHVSGDGKVVSDRLLQKAPLPPAEEESVAVASSNHLTVVAWTILGTPLGYATSISATGDVNPTVALPLDGESALGAIALLPTGSGYTVVWNTKGEISAARLDESARLLDTQPVILGNGNFSSAASSGHTIEIAIRNEKTSLVTILTAASGPNGIVPKSLASPLVTAVRQLSPALASDGLDFLTVWREWSGAHWSTIAGRFNRSGDSLDGTGVALSGDADVVRTALARGPGSQTLIVQTTNNGMLATRWSGATGPLDSNPIVVSSTYGGDPAVAWNGSRYFVVWVAGSQLLGAFIGSDGAASTPIALPFAAADFPGGPSSPDLAWDGREFLVTVPVIANLYCLTTCPSMPPGEVRIIRVSAEGNVLDHPAITIPGLHRGARVATSGSEFLVVLDTGASVSSVAVRANASGVEVGAEETIFSWIAEAPSAVAWDGSAYIVSWRYASGDGAWLAAARVGHGGEVSQASVTGAFRPDPHFGWSAPSIAVNDAGDTAIAVDEAAPPSYLSRVRAYFVSELGPMPPAPAAPRNVVNHFSGNTALIEWQSDGAANGFLLEVSPDVGHTWFFAGTLSGDVRSTTLSASTGTQFRVSAFGPGGLSSGTITIIGSEPRRRAVRR
jgi:hypothetical protein